MRVIPVIDVMKSVAVHGVRGERERYLPLKTPFSSTPDPVDVALGLRRSFGFDELYIADLDSIMRRMSNIEAVERICRVTGMKVMVDSGVDNADDALRVLEAGVEKIVIGTETLASLSSVKDVLHTVSEEHMVVSIDVLGGGILTRCVELAGLKPSSAAERIVSLGVRELILLDISRVGSLEGVDIEMVKNVVSKVDASILVGGGVRRIGDLLQLKEIGASGVLVATALHKGWLIKEDLSRVQ